MSKFMVLKMNGVIKKIDSRARRKGRLGAVCIRKGKREGYDLNF